MSRRLGVGVVALAMAVLFSASASATTSVSFDGTVVTLHVPVDVIGMADYDFRNPDTGKYTDDPTTAARRIQDAANAMWNDQLADLPFADCFTFRVAIELNPLPGGHAGNPGSHHITYNKEPTFRSYVTWPPGTPARGDSAELFNGSGGGEWFLHDTWTVAHEAGHLLGLDDDYSDVGGVYRAVKSIPKPGRQGTMMDGGTLVDQDLVDRLAHLIDKAGSTLPECWRGTIHSETQRIYRNFHATPPFTGTCTDAWETEVRFVVAGDRTVTGEAAARLVDEGSCSWDRHPWPPITEYRASVVGTADEDAFRLRLGFVSLSPESDALTWAGITSLLITHGGGAVPSPEGPILEIPRVDPCLATGAVTLEDTFPSPGAHDTLTSTNTIELSCDEEPVG